MRIGSLVYCTDQGLGILAKAFYDHAILTDVLVVRHGKRPEHDEWYPDSQRIYSFLRERSTILDFCSSMDAMLFFETPFIWELLPHCHSKNIPAILMTMYECMPKVLPYKPRAILCPSLLDLDYYKEYKDRARFIPVPICLDPTCPCTHKLTHVPRTCASLFVHNSGHGGLKGRNGTAELLEAWNYVKSPAQLLVRSQSPLQVGGRLAARHKIRVQTGTILHSRLYSEGDVFIFPEKFNGLSLPLQEAYASGMLVMATRRYPISTWLPNEPLIEPEGYKGSSVSPRCNDFEEAVLCPRTIAAKVDEWFGMDTTTYSEQGRLWAEGNSWATLKPQYLEYIQNVVYR